MSNIGKLFERIEIREASYSQDGYGAVSVTYSSLGEVWCEVTDFGGNPREIDSNDKKTYVDPINFKIRKNNFTNFPSTNIIVYEGNLYDVVGVKTSGIRHKEYWEIDAALKQ